MSVESAITYTGPLIANGTATAFSFTFLAMNASEIEVYGLDEDGEEVTLPDYTAELTGTAPSVGIVTFDTPPDDGTRVWIASDPSFLQSIAFEDGSRWLAGPVNQANDRAALRSLALKRDVDRSVRLPIGEAGVTLPAGSGPTLYISVLTLAGIASDISIVAGRAGDVEIVAGDLAGGNTIGTVAANIEPIVTLGTNYNKLSDIYDALAQIDVVYNDLSGDNTIGTVATNIIPIGALALNMAALLAVDANEANINAVAGDLLGDNNIGEVADNIAEVALVGQDLMLGDEESFILRAPQAAIDAISAQIATENVMVTLAQASGTVTAYYDTKTALATAMNAGNILTTNGLYVVTYDETARGARTLYRWRNTQSGFGTTLVSGVSKTLGVLDPIGIMNQNAAPSPPNDMPHGLVLYYAARDYVATYSGLPTHLIPNRATTVPAEPLLGRTTTKQFKYTGAQTQSWIGNPNTSALVITDKYSTGPLGYASATRLNGTGGALQYITNTGQVIPSGQNTFAVWIKSNTGVNQNLQLTGNAGGAYQAIVVTSFWQRFTVTWTDGANRTGGIRIANDGAAAWDVLIDMAKVYSGATAQPDQPAAGHMYLGLGHADANAVVPSGGIYDGTGGTKTPGLAEVADPISSREMTIGAMVYCSANTGTNSYIFVDQVTQNTGLQDVSVSADFPQGNPRGVLAGTGTVARLSQSHNIAGKGWHWLWFRMRHNRSYFGIDDMLLSSADVGVAIAEQLTDAWRTGSYSGGLASNYKWNQIAVWRRALGDRELNQAYKGAQRVAALDGIAATPVRNLVVVEGDSRPSYTGTGANANKSWADLYLQSNPPNAVVSRRSVPGSVITGSTINLTDRAEDIDMCLPPIADRVGRCFIIVEETGANDLVIFTDAQYLTNLAAWYAARKAAGWTKVGVLTVLNRTDAGAGANFTTRRNAVNTALRAASPGAYFDFLIDVAADATIGTDAAPNDPTYFPDKLHGNTAAHAIYHTYTEPAIDAVLV